MGKRGQKIEINEEYLADLAKRQWPVESIAAHFKCSRDVLYRRFRTIMDENRQLGVATLLDAAWDQARSGNWMALKYLLDRFLPDSIPKAPSDVNINVTQQQVVVNQPARIEKTKILELYEALLTDGGEPAASSKGPAAT